MYKNSEDIYQAAIETIDTTLKAIVPKDRMTEVTANQLLGTVAAVCTMVRILEREGD